MGWAELHHGLVRQKFPEQGAKSRLGGGAQHSGNAVMLHQLGDSIYAGTQVGQGEHLGLVKDNDTVRQIVELAALG